MTVHPKVPMHGALVLLALLVPAGACAPVDGTAAGGPAIQFPGFAVRAGSQLFTAHYYTDPVLPDRYEVVLAEDATCSAGDGFGLHIGDRFVAFQLFAPAVGSCSAVTRFPELGDEPLRGCHFTLRVLHPDAARIRVRDATVRIDRLDGGTVAGELRLLASDPRLTTRSCPTYAGDGACSCDGPEGPFECPFVDPDGRSCCLDALPWIPVAFPFEATHCPAAGACSSRTCLPELAASCTPAVPAPSSCIAACDAYERVCTDCTDSRPENPGCEREECLEQCQALAALDPAVSLSLACVETSGTCSGWASCVSACGAP